MSQKLSNALKQGDQTPVILKSNSELKIDVRILENDDGSISINAEDTAIGFGWSRTESKNGKEYTSIMWSRMNGFCKELGFAHECAKDDYIPESLFYRLGMKASNERAQKFQGWLADEVIPEIRKNGSYIFSGLSEEMKVLLSHDKKLVQVENRVNKLENNMTLDYGQQQIIQTLVNNRATEILGGKTSMAYKLLSKKTFPEIYRALKNSFQVPSYKDIPVVRFDKAKEMVLKWTPSQELKLMIIGANTQVSKEV